MDHDGGQIPSLRQQRCFCGRNCCSAGERHQGRKDGNAPPWRSDEDYASKVLLDVICSR